MCLQSFTQMLCLLGLLRLWTYIIVDVQLIRPVLTQLLVSSKPSLQVQLRMKTSSWYGIFVTIWLWNNLLKDCSLFPSSTTQVRSQSRCPKAPTFALSPTPWFSIGLPARFDHCSGRPSPSGEIGLSPRLPGMWIIELQSHYPFWPCSTRFIDKTLVITIPTGKYNASMTLTAWAMVWILHVILFGYISIWKIYIYSSKAWYRRALESESAPAWMPLQRCLISRRVHQWQEVSFEWLTTMQTTYRTRWNWRCCIWEPCNGQYDESTLHLPHTGSKDLYSHFFLGSADLSNIAP